VSFSEGSPRLAALMWATWRGLSSSSSSSSRELAERDAALGEALVVQLGEWRRQLGGAPRQLLEEAAAGWAQQALNQVRLGRGGIQGSGSGRETGGVEL
jgi:hypothetical protein